ncbi:MAG TPA: hypothetical protein VN651_14045 [Gemmatimonadaceae bacterium]|nr:hypothetical protein [Gemmatimonadaceae bacterium]
MFDRNLAVRRRITLGLTVAGFGAGAVFGLALTVFGKIVAGAPPATLGNYLWNAGVFGGLAAVVSPLVSWSALRNVPLWRTVFEPLALAVAGGLIGVLAGSGILFLALPPIALLAGFVRLSRAYPSTGVANAANADAFPR